MKKVVKRIAINTVLFIPVLILSAMACVFTFLSIVGHALEVTVDPMRDECASCADKLTKKMKNESDK